MIVEALERRVMLTLTPVRGTLTLSGSGGNDEYEITQSAGKITLHTLLLNGVAVNTTDATTVNVSKLIVNMLGGNDLVRLRRSDYALPVTIQSTITGGAGNDTLGGGDGPDSISGDDGDDLLKGRGGQDILAGGNNFDTADYSFYTVPVTVSLDGVANDGSANEKDNAQTEVILGGTANDLLIGNGSANFIDGGAGNDTIAGRDGNDTLTGGIGADQVFGEGGNDFVFARDGLLDQINDGAGTDSANIDSKLLGDLLNDAATAASAPAVPASALLISAALSSVLSLPDDANPGDLDVTFDADGKVTISRSDLWSVSDVAVQSVETVDGTVDKILIAGTLSSETRGSDFFLMRLNPDGSVDSTFGDAVDSEFPEVRTGFTTTDFGTNVDTTFDDEAARMLIHDGNILVVGSTSPNFGASAFSPVGGSVNSDFAIARYTFDGQADDSFGDAGRVVVDFGDVETESSDGAHDIAVQSVSNGEGFDDRYVIVGQATQFFSESSDDNIGIVRLFGNGSEDGSFGQVIYGDSETSEDGKAVVIDDAQNIWVAAAIDSHASIVGFGGDGTTAVEHAFTFNDDPSLDVTPYDLALDGNLLVMAGDAVDNSLETTSGALATMDIDPDALVPNAQESALVDGPLGATMFFHAVTVDKAGRAVAVGTTFGGSTGADFAVYRFNTADLTPDGFFVLDGTGLTTTDFGDGVSTFPNDDGVGVAVQADGAIVAAGGSFGAESPAIAVARYAGGNGIAEDFIDEQRFNAFSFTHEEIVGGVPTNLPLPLELVLRVRPLIVNGELTIDGTSGDNRIIVTRGIDGAGNAFLGVDLDQTFYTFPAALITAITINGLGGNDYLQVDAAITIPAKLNGGTGNDTVIGGGGNDELAGGAGNDTYRYGVPTPATGVIAAITTSNVRPASDPQTDSIIENAGDGTDTLDLAALPATVGARVDLSGASTFATLGTTSIRNPAGGINIENVLGGRGHDRIIGNALVNVISGGEGNDAIVGKGGNDDLTGDAGNDLIIGGAGADKLTGSAGDDILIGGTTSYDNSFSSLDGIIAQWAAANVTYTNRVNQLSLATNAFRLIAGQSVFDDNVTDTVTGSSGSDWFFARTSGNTKDKLNDRDSKEVLRSL